jgi:hypothetical protein
MGGGKHNVASDLNQLKIKIKDSMDLELKSLKYSSSVKTYKLTKEELEQYNKK